MNLLLFKDQDILSPGHARIPNDRRLIHITSVLRSKVGDTLKCGHLGGKVGRAEILSMSPESIEFGFELTDLPPAPLSLSLLVALPRPKFVPKVIHAAVNLGVKRITFMNTARVEKVYWSCAQISPEALLETSLLALEQARDTILPEITMERLFKPFVEDRLPQITQGKLALLADPNAKDECPYAVKDEVLLAIGPEGGFISYEIEKLESAGLKSVRALERILKVETAVSALIGRLV